ncbi:hypothetical protein CABS01_01187 [Colletotrichum abscissum]|uniref:Uncharacterized protein n=1 Tax=Colletotrichum abscissum TaxID=1671311 RepID=A0A9Q0B0N1_9PEZI|nr:uncharacterized protein CABS01_01187 [Colletotrichum abscissum]KAI3537839.1 hypothetical protein CABS02_11990 [Colletotrichum abscissum]KAK1505719.1 hypothetical protein CABS01_01187 [Colletotrichum abscissum]
MLAHVSIVKTTLSNAGWQLPKQMLTSGLLFAEEGKVRGHVVMATCDYGFANNEVGSSRAVWHPQCQAGDE